MSNRLRGGAGVDLALLAVAIVWGSSYLGAKSVVTPATVMGFLSLRFGIAVICLAIPLTARLRRTTVKELKLGALYGAILAVVFVLETVGVTGTTASNAGLIISLTMLMTPWLESRIKRQTMPREYVWAVVLALSGVALLTQSEGLSEPSWGDGLMLLAAAARAVHVTVIDCTSDSNNVDTARVTVIQLAVVMVGFAALASLVGSSPWTVAWQFDRMDWALTVYLAVVCTVFAFFVQMWAVRRTSPSRVSLMLGSEPLWAAALGISLGGEPMTVTVVAGAACILVGTTYGRRARAEVPVKAEFSSRALVTASDDR